jgi:hypothetical protein
MFTFEYLDTLHTTETEEEMEVFVMKWIEDNFQLFVNYGSEKFGTTNKDNFDDVLGSFYENTVKEGER